MNIVLDTNSLIMSIAPRSPYRKVWNAFLRGDYNLCVSNEIIEDIQRFYLVIYPLKFLRP